MAIFFAQYNYGVLYVIAIEKRALWIREDFRACSTVRECLPT